MGEGWSHVAGRLDGKIAVVTGGGNGIGRACCERFAEEGASVVVADILDDQGQETVGAVEGLGAKALFVHLDASSQADNDAAMRAAVDTFGQIDILLTAAGISHAAYRSGDREVEMEQLANVAENMQDPSRSFLDLPFEGWQRVIDVNLTGTFLAVQAASRLMVEAGTGGAIVTIASVAAKVPEAGPLSYAVSKAGVWMLTKHAARSLGPAGIRINAIGPGFIETNMTRIIGEIPMIRDQLIATLPLRRMGVPRDVANTALFLVSEESAYFTGEILHPDGGMYTD
ncbi:MAG: 3-oxoacyl-[acyl-carrier protein] reductase [Acidimicrobiaceae bacterium]|jgi:NAD(P)-dependent dehydrogenase (short-subunit alcohol dehydrogenase family)|nr:3-oxoacyl-[acyl-carrier protein] reductase [Acidimicrobiaceae bacterium]